MRNVPEAVRRPKLKTLPITKAMLAVVEDVRRVALVYEKAGGGARRSARKKKG